MSKKKQQNNMYIGGGVLVAVALASVLIVPTFMNVNYDSQEDGLETGIAGAIGEVLNAGSKTKNENKKDVATHIKTPESVKALYMTSWVAGTASIREPLIKFIEENEFNSIVIDIKDDTGKISYNVETPELVEVGGFENRIPDIRELIERLHEKGIYVIGRVSTFQDPHLVKVWPEEAVKRASDGGIWKDRKGISWMDAGSKKVWDYVLAIARESYDVGFDEINFDYVRFPSDGNMEDIAFPLSGNKAKPEVIESFFAYVYENLKDEGMVRSADLFGMTTTAVDDLNIGQELERALPYFDYIAPMVYPSHYPNGFNGYGDPDDFPYEVIKVAMGTAVERVEAMKLATTTVSAEIRDRISSDQLRPWLQDFDYGGDYDVAEVRAQIKATYDVGLDSWMMWSASNKYTTNAYSN